MRKYPIGAELIKNRGVHFRLWAPDHHTVSLVVSKGDRWVTHRMHREKKGYFSLWVPGIGEGTLYHFILPRSRLAYADPASRYQPQGPLGPSCVVDPAFPWTDKRWKGIKLEGQVIYEMHIGTFTTEGTLAAATEQLEELARLGITCIELMPLNDFPGRFGWGYDGVNLFAPCRLYGTPKDVKVFINKAHHLGLGVVLDVVYNHLGPEGNYLPAFSKSYLSKKKTTDWGATINFDHPSSREFFLTNAQYWIEEFHFDGIRVDASSELFCTTPRHILAELSQVVKRAGGKRSTLVIGENEPQNTQLLQPIEAGGYGFDALWNDDFHHTAQVRLTGKREAYYTDYLGSPQEMISCLKHGFLYQGQYYSWQEKPRGTADLNLDARTMILFLENHDQVANSGNSRRLWDRCDRGNLKAMTALMLLGPNTPMLFQGQEFGSTAPFYYFAEHSEDMNKYIKKGRREDLSQFPRLATKKVRKGLTDPSDPLTFTQCKLNFREREENAHLYALHRDLLKLRRTDRVFSRMEKIEGAVLGTDSFLIRYFGTNFDDRLLLVNFGPDHYFNPAPEPLLAPQTGCSWEVLWSSEDPKYLGEGTPPVNIPYWKILGHSAVVLKSRKGRGK